MQETRRVNWTNARILAAGKRFGPWPGWTKRTGNEGIGIAPDTKAAGRSVEVVRGRRKVIGPTFAIKGKKDAEGTSTRRPNNRRSSNMQKQSGSSTLKSVLMLLLLTGCATKSPPSPPVIADPVRLTPLPLSVTAIDSASSAAYLAKVSTWLSKVEQSLGAGTRK